MRTRRRTLWETDRKSIHFRTALSIEDRHGHTGKQVWWSHREQYYIRSSDICADTGNDLVFKESPLRYMQIETQESRSTDYLQVVYRCFNHSLTCEDKVVVVLPLNSTNNVPIIVLCNVTNVSETPPPTTSRAHVHHRRQNLFWGQRLERKPLSLLPYEKKDVTKGIS